MHKYHLRIPRVHLCIYKEDDNDNMSLLDYRVDLIKALCGGVEPKTLKDDDETSFKKHRLHGKHFLKLLPKNKRRDCRVCSKTNGKRKLTYFQCENCLVGLCPTECNKAYHTLAIYK